MVVQRRIGGWSKRCGEGPAYRRDGVEQSEHDHLITGIGRTLEPVQALDDRFCDRQDELPPSLRNAPSTSSKSAE